MAALPLTEHAFEVAADATLQDLVRALDALEDLECDLQMGVLTLTFSDGVRYVVNSHRAAKQIWMAAEQSAWHFDPVEAPGGAPAWVAPKNGDALWATVSRVLSQKLARAVTLRGGQNP